MTNISTGGQFLKTPVGANSAECHRTVTFKKLASGQASFILGNYVPR
jgi:hypothetical protein